ncbi:MAG: hypothetical protein UV55_C0048G0003 [Candidatus Gottesmanbacteria bacterium GW2011_GWC1_43_10]|nr:MAG: hypothetical protein UV55_C0048G0003 [Candidatus Gottesmanbacteria bacterium GW2011_GWC1_43_10]OGG10436.1 MAG: hypothetical protein A2699_05220 [Candidatus Gottesmanbacteria bacterium RIFCSPHIGHO2_01_FULL_43_15]
MCAGDPTFDFGQYLYVTLVEAENSNRHIYEVKREGTLNSTFYRPHLETYSAQTSARGLTESALITAIKTVAQKKLNLGGYPEEPWR